MNTIRPTDVGKRVSIQFYTSDGSRSEAVGTFERAEMSEGDVIVFVRKRDDSVVEVPMKRIRFGKVVGPPRA